MSLRYKGGVISATPPTPTSSAATGVWTLEQQLQAEASGNWPSQIYFGEAMRSLRFNSADSASLTRTFPSAGNRKTWTWSGWLKRTALSDTYGGALFICSSGSSDSTYTVLWFYANAIRFQAYNTLWRVTSAVYRDLSAWYHVVLALDTTQATANNRIKLYVNGSQVTDFSTTNNPNQNDDLYINSANLHRIGEGDSFYSDMYLTEVVFVDGQALTPSSFGQTNSTTGVWEPKEITGLTYGTNGFYLNFQDNSGTTSTTLGKDSSGNGNNWTPNNFSVTAGAGNDSLVDTPTPYGTDTGAGGEVRGNYATLNPLLVSSTYVTIANGNLSSSSIQGTATYQEIPATFAVNFSGSGKWYAEVNVTTVASTYYPSIAISSATKNFLAKDVQGGDSSNSTAYMANGQKYNNGTLSSYGSSYTGGDTIGIAVDEAAGTVVMYKNNVSQGTLASSLTGLQYITITTTNSSAFSVNFGQRPFAYTAPSGYKALCTQNLPAPTVVQGDDYFNAALYTGNGTSQSITGVGFQPDLVWTKSRSNAYNNTLVDSVRGVSRALVSDLTAAEDFSSGSYVTAFNSDGFSVGSGTGSNGNGATYVGWAWKGGGTGVSNTQGTITSTVSANTTAGFSVVTYTGNATAGATVGHGLGAVPELIIIKRRSTAADWVTYHAPLGNTNCMFLNLTLGSTGTSAWNSTTPTSTLITLGNQTEVNSSSGTFVAYCFAPIAGFSAFGKYTGNGSSWPDSPFIYTGFRPALVLIKRSDTTGSWLIYDNKRDGYNYNNDQLYPNLSDAEGDGQGDGGYINLLSNGFKMNNAATDKNANGGTYIYAAFAQNPFKYALAR